MGTSDGLDPGGEFLGNLGEDGIGEAELGGGYWKWYLGVRIELGR